MIKSCNICRVNDVEATADEGACRGPSLPVSNDDSIAPQVFSKVIAKWLNTKVFEIYRLVVFYDFGINGLISNTSKGLAHKSFALEQLVHRAIAFEITPRL